MEKSEIIRLVDLLIMEVEAFYESENISVGLNCQENNELQDLINKYKEADGKTG